MGEQNGEHDDSRGHGHGSKDRLYEAAIAALLVEPTVEKAARKANVKYRTLKSWLALPEFQRLYAAARRQVLEYTLGLLLAAQADAVAALKRNLSCDNVVAQNKAAELLLRIGMEGIQIVDFVQRLEAIEELMKPHQDRLRERSGGTRP